MLIVVDTNVFVTALLHGRTPRKVYDAFLDGLFTPVFSRETMAELLEVLSRPPLRVLMSETEITQFLRLLKRDAVIVYLRNRVHACRDPKDDTILDCALAASASHIVTGDLDLLALNPFRGIHVVRPSEFLKFLA